MSGDTMGVEVGGLTHFANTAAGMAGDLRNAAATARTAKADTLVPMFGELGAEFVGAYAGVVDQHAAAIAGLAATVDGFASAATSNAAAYTGMDQATGDSLAVDRSGVNHTAASAAASSFHDGFAAATHHGTTSKSTERHRRDGVAGSRSRRPAAAQAGLVGGGAVVSLPGSRKAVAPNPRAATAVRAALSQLGVSYQWGGSMPGVGLDCSGLTQFAYREAGVPLAHYAADQRVGRFLGVDPGRARPGDLVVWDQHVAMVVGDGQMIEAGDPVRISSIRTTNMGDQFYGFYRPTEPTDPAEVA